MRISENIDRLRAFRGAAPSSGGDDRLADMGDFGPNPGNLRARIYVPQRLASPAPLVVVLHGCTQDAAAYDQGSGWTHMADRHGFALLFPEQRRANNPNLCFNWFASGDIQRGGGEAESIRQMIAAAVTRYRLDPAQIFITGLSAGGAMASVMLAVHPELFAAGAIIAGVPYGCADSIPDAFGCMGGRGRMPATSLGDNVRRASAHKGPWPRISVWHGTADQTVTASNGDDIVKQWLNVHGLRAKPDISGKVDGYPHRAWLGTDGRPAIEQYVITGMGHGTPLAPGEEPGQSGAAGPHMLDAAISSTDRIAAFFGIADDVPEIAAPRPKVKRKVAEPVSGVQAVIEDALRSAGLLR